MLCVYDVISCFRLLPLAQEAAQQSDLAMQLRRLSATLHAHKTASTARGTKLLNRAAEVLRHTQVCERQDQRQCRESHPSPSP